MKSATMAPPAGAGTAQSTRKLNCWEYKKCGRQPQGFHVRDLGLCPATVETGLDDVHEGTNGGRACWVVSGSLCGGKVQGSFASKLTGCMACDFYAAVKAEEGASYLGSASLLEVLGSVTEPVGRPASIQGRAGNGRTVR